jgi:hypothetical protein
MSDYIESVGNQLEEMNQSQSCKSESFSPLSHPESTLSVTERSEVLI